MNRHNPKRDTIRLMAAGLVLGLGLGSANTALAQDDGPQIMPNYREADIRQIIEAVGEVTGRNFLVDPRVNGSVTLLSYSPMSPDAFYYAFLSTLQVHAFAALGDPAVRAAGRFGEVVLLDVSLRERPDRQLPGRRL